MATHLRGNQEVERGLYKGEKGPSEYNSVEFGPDRLQQLRVEEVLTQAEGAPVTSAHAAQPGVAEERYEEDKHQHIVYIYNAQKEERQDRVKTCHHHERSSLWLILTTNLLK